MNMQPPSAMIIFLLFLLILFVEVNTWAFQLRPFKRRVCLDRETSKRINPFSATVATSKSESAFPRDFREKMKQALLLDKIESTGPSSSLNRQRLNELEALSEEISTFIESETEREKLLSMYFFMLQEVSLKPLDSLQLITFRTFSRVLFKQLTSVLDRDGDEAAEANLIDEFNDLHLNFIDQFHFQLKNNCFVSSALHQGKPLMFFVYQLANLLKGAYQEFSMFADEIVFTKLEEFDDSARRWVGPVFARLKRKFPEFSLESLSTKLEETYSQTIEQLCDRFSFEITPKYSYALPNCFELNASKPLISDRRTNPSSPRGYPAWQLTETFTKLIRNSINPNDNPELVESIVLRKLRESILSRLQPITTHLEEIMEDRSSYELDDYQRETLEKGINLGQDLVAMVYTHWQLVNSIIGIYNATSELYEKEFIRPVTSFKNKAYVYGSIPNNITMIIESVIDNEFTQKEKEELALPAEIEGFSLMAQAIRIFTTEFYQSIILESSSATSSSTNSSVANKKDARGKSSITTTASLNSDRDQNFNAMHCAILNQLFFHTLVAPEYPRRQLFEQLLGCVALEIVLNVREPRKMALIAYELAIYYALDYLYEEVVTPLFPSQTPNTGRQGEYERNKVSANDEDTVEAMDYEEERGDEDEENKDEDEADLDEETRKYRAKLKQNQLRRQVPRTTEKAQSLQRRKEKQKRNRERLRGLSVADEEGKEQILSLLKSYDFSTRLREIELCLHYFLDASAATESASFEDLFSLRFDAYETFISKLSAKYVGTHNTEVGMISFLQVQSKPFITLLFDKQEHIEAAGEYILAIGVKQFEESLSNILLNVNLVLSMPEMGEVYYQQLMTMGKELFVSEELILQYLQQLIVQYFGTLYDVIVEESMGKNLNRMEYFVLDLCKLYQHPLIERLGSIDDVMIRSLNHYLTNYPSNQAIELIRVCEKTRNKLAQRAQKVQQEQSILVTANGLSREDQELLLPKAIEGWGSDSKEIDGLNDLPQIQLYLRRLHQMQLHLLKEVTSSNRCSASCIPFVHNVHREMKSSCIRNE